MEYHINAVLLLTRENRCSEIPNKDTSCFAHQMSKFVNMINECGQYVIDVYLVFCFLHFLQYHTGICKNGTYHHLHHKEWFVIHHNKYIAYDI